ncbi:hypothetical protein IB680_03930 [Francisella philomiragia]|uniref:hypothetical protein n=1 Tax=Francisella philomiragia TaxID=28110 RepID=UPI000B58F470|nr:hypothetical protein [Francisella philomiragia]MBK2094819.1 hypothetical protein [Francisella philomiragia]
MKNIILTFLSLSFLQISQAYFVKIAKDNHMSQPGYITTIYESNVQATAVNSDQTKLFTVFRPSDNYCLSVTKLSYSINNTGSITSCFDNKHTVGNKVNKIILDKLGKTFYLLSNYNILAYNISPITNRINGQIFRKRFIQKIIDAKLVDEGKYLYLLTTSDKSQKGKLIIYRVNTDGSLDELNIVTLNYKPKKIIFDNIERVYIQSDKSIYFYSFLGNGNIIKDNKIITISSGEILDFSVITENSTASKIILAEKENIEGQNVEQGAVSVYKFSSDMVRLLYKNSYENIPLQVASYINKATNQESMIAVFENEYKVSSVTNSFLMLNFESKNDGSLISIYQKDNMVGIISSQSAIIYDLKDDGLLAVLSLGEVSDKSSFMSDKFIGAGNEKSINIFQI